MFFRLVLRVCYNENPRHQLHMQTQNTWNSGFQMGQRQKRQPEANGTNGN